MTESKLIVACRISVGDEETWEGEVIKGHKKIWGVNQVLIMFIDFCDGVADVYPYVKSYQIVHCKLVPFITYELYHNKAVKIYGAQLTEL